MSATLLLVALSSLDERPGEEPPAAPEALELPATNATPPPHREAARRVGFRVVALGAVAGGLGAPAVGGGLRLGVGLGSQGWFRPHARLGVDFFADARLENSAGTATRSLVAGRADLCPVGVGPERIVLSVCGAGTIGEVRLEGNSVPNPRKEARLYSALGGLARVNARVVSNLARSSLPECSCRSSAIASSSSPTPTCSPSMRPSRSPKQDYRGRFRDRCERPCAWCGGVHVRAVKAKTLAALGLGTAPAAAGTLAMLGGWKILAASALVLGGAAAAGMWPGTDTSATTTRLIPSVVASSVASASAAAPAIDVVAPTMAVPADKPVSPSPVVVAASPEGRERSFAPTALASSARRMATP